MTIEWLYEETINKKTQTFKHYNLISQIKINKKTKKKFMHPFVLPLYSQGYSQNMSLLGNHNFPRYYSILDSFTQVLTF
jgi:hypothetical protein